MNDIGKVLGASQSTVLFFDNLRGVISWSLILDILIVTVLFYWVYLFLHETRAMRILYGLLVIVALSLMGHLFNLIMLNWILKYLMTGLVVAIPVVFQPELRAALEKLGRSKFLGELAFYKEKNSNLVNILSAVVMSCSKQKIGCLIVVQRRTGLREYIENGIRLNAQVSSALLNSIFFPKSPLHDGAVIIVGDQILSAKSILPVSGASIHPGLGTRHRAGLGISEISDAVAIIVSEETGTISLSVGGKLERRISEERLKTQLSNLLVNGKK